MNSNKLANISLAGCAIVIAGLVAWRELRPVPAPSISMRVIWNWPEVSGGGHLLHGRSDAPVKIVTFGDFQCPSCARASHDLEDLDQRHPGLLAIYFRHYPIRAIHEHAYMASVAAECAAEQDRFKGYHDALYGAVDKIGQIPWREFARRAAVPDLDRFDRCIDESTSARARVAADTMIAYDLGVRVTPSFAVNGRLLSGTPPTPDSWDELVRRMIAEQSSRGSSRD